VIARRLSSLIVVLVFGAGLLGPGLVGFVSAASQNASGCSCVVKMDCCERGICPMAKEASRSGGPILRACGASESAPALTSIQFQAVLPALTGSQPAETSIRARLGTPDRPNEVVLERNTPPPRQVV